MLPIQIRRRQAKVQGQADPWQDVPAPPGLAGAGTRVSSSNTSEGAGWLRFMSALYNGSK
jgi:hypothetical protein